jgi:hypothetical protein
MNMIVFTMLAWRLAAVTVWLVVMVAAVDLVARHLRRPAAPSPPLSAARRLASGASSLTRCPNGST